MKGFRPKSDIGMAVAFLRAAGVEPEVWQGSKHWRLRWRINGRTFNATVSVSPSGEWRSSKNMLRDLRRKIMQAGDVANN
jgi:hypothetical protein